MLLPLMTIFSGLTACDSETEEAIFDECFFDTPSSLSDDAALAVDMSPMWLKMDLARAFLKMTPEEQDPLARTIIDAASLEYIDEIAFVLAHSRVELLTDLAFKPELLEENIRQIYELTGELGTSPLKYIERVEVGTAGESCEFSTTMSYRLLDSEGQEKWVELPSELYYWHVVHPVMEDERPIYVDPTRDFVSNATGYAEGFAEPPAGHFWRSYFYDVQDDVCPYGDDDPEDDAPCPRLGDMLEAADYLWDGQQNSIASSHAIGAVTQWLNIAMDFGANGTRPIQPVRIYAEHDGNCGEYADITTAAARSALIPSGNVYAFLWDHTWNEFWADGWHHWEPYQAEANDPIIRAVDHVDHWWDHKGAAITLGDGTLQGVSSHYTDQLADIEVQVKDASGAPVKDATVSFFGYNNGECCMWFYSNETDADGILTLQIGVAGEQQPILGRVTKFEQTFPVEANTADIVVGEAKPDESYVWEVVLE